jgi:hypothetical protein
VQSEIVKADPKTRQRYIVFVLAGAVIGGVAVYSASGYWARLETELQAKPTPERLEQILGEIKLVFGIVCSVVWLGVANLVYQGFRILRTGQFPLPNTRVFRDTPVLRGKAARIRAFILIGLAAVLGVLLIVLAVMGLGFLEYFQKRI